MFCRKGVGYMDCISQVRMLETKEELCAAETLRYQAFNYDLEDFNPNDTACISQINNGLIIPFGMFFKDANNEKEYLVACCYVSNYKGTLYVDHLFVKPMYQNTGLRLGRMLLRFVLANKQEVEKELKHKFSKSTIEPIDEKSEALYLKEGYEYQDEMMVKKI